MRSGNGKKDITGGKALSKTQKEAIKALAAAQGKLPTLITKPGTNYPDFDAMGTIYVHPNGTKAVYQLPITHPDTGIDLWKASDYKQFKYLNDTYFGGVQPSGYTWHHSEITGQMELVQFGSHNIMSHNGGRSLGGWCSGKR